MQIVDDDYDDSDDDTFGILLTLRGSSPISQEVSKLPHCSALFWCNVMKANITVENLDFRLKSVVIFGKKILQCRKV